MTQTNSTLLSDKEPGAYTTVRDTKTGPFLIAVDHASNAIPASLDSLGLTDHDLQRHIAYDIGALDVAKIIAEELQAPLIYQNYSRLVIDSNRRPEARDAIPEISEYTSIPGNKPISKQDRQKRIDEIHQPYHQAISDMLDNWQGNNPIFVAIHSCTPVYKEEVRELEIGCLYGNDRRFAGLVLNCLQKKIGSAAADNQPYQVSLENDYSIPVHAEERHLLYVEIEFRQDLISDAEGVRKWASILKAALIEASQCLVNQ